MIKTVIVKNTRDQKIYSFENAEVSTLKDVKDLLNSKSVNYSNLEFHVGFANIVLLEDNSPIPASVTKSDGTVITDKIVFLLTNSANNIKSGAMTRAQAYTNIKACGALKEYIKNKHNRQYMMISTEDLEKDIIEFNSAHNVATPSSVVATPASSVDSKSIDGIKSAIRMIANYLYDGDFISSSLHTDILESIEGKNAVEDSLKSLVDEAFNEANL